MRIVDVMDKDIRASAQFKYKGWIVSMSTIFRGVGVSVYVFKDGYRLECKSVEQAIELIDREPML